MTSDLTCTVVLEYPRLTCIIKENLKRNKKEEAQEAPMLFHTPLLCQNRALLTALPR